MEANIEQFVASLAGNDQPRIPLFMAQVESNAEVDECIAQGWKYGLHSYNWHDGTGSRRWFDKVRPYGRKVHCAWSAWRNATSITSTDDFILPSTVPNGGWNAPGDAGFRPHGQAGFDLLQANPDLLPMIGATHIEFESGPTNAQPVTPNNYDWMVDTWEFFRDSMASLGISDRTYCYRTVSSVISDGTRSYFLPDWCRLYYPYLAAADSQALPSSISHFSLRGIAGHYYDPAQSKTAAYIQGPYAWPITDTTNWRGSGAGSIDYCQPGYTLWMRLFANFDRIGQLGWLTFYSISAGNQKRKPYLDDAWPDLLRAIDDWVGQTITANEGVSSVQQVQCANVF